MPAVTRPPSSELETPFKEAVRDYARAGETEYAKLYEPALEDFGTYLSTLRSAELGQGLPEGWVPCSTLWLTDESSEIVGVVRVRHRLNAYLEREAGHVGYDVPPSKRGRGYGSACLEAGLAKALELGIASVLVVCDADNVPSMRIIEKRGGRFDGEVVAELDGKVVRRYWFDLSKG